MANEATIQEIVKTFNVEGQLSSSDVATLIKALRDHGVVPFEGLYEIRFNLITSNPLCVTVRAGSVEEAIQKVCDGFENVGLSAFNLEEDIDPDTDLVISDIWGDDISEDDVDGVIADL